MHNLTSEGITKRFKFATVLYQLNHKMKKLNFNGVSVLSDLLAFNYLNLVISQNINGFKTKHKQITTLILLKEANK